MIYENILRLCKERNIPISRLEKECVIGNGTVKGWQISSPTVANAQKVANYFGITLDELVKEEGE